MNKIFTKSSYNNVERGIRTKKSEINSLMEINSLFQEKKYCSVNFGRGPI